MDKETPSTGIKKALEDSLKHYKELNKKFPNRHKEIHKQPCIQCPSNNDKLNNKEDPECKDIKENNSKEYIAKNLLFVCAWRTNKLCKGLCDYYEITEEMTNG